MPSAVTCPPVCFCSIKRYLCSSSPLRPHETPVTHLCLLLCLLQTQRSPRSFQPPPSIEMRGFLLGLCCFFCVYRSLSGETTCKLKAKFNLSGYKNVEKKKVVIGGMFPVHKRVASSNGTTSSQQVSSGCEG